MLKTSWWYQSIIKCIISFYKALGWKREMVRFRNYGRRCVYYVSPCGRRFRNMGEVHRYATHDNYDVA